MATTMSAYTKKDKVEAAVDLPGVPAGTPGKILVANGFAWNRYYVKFDNGVAIGSIDGQYLRRRSKK